MSMGYDTNFAGQFLLDKPMAFEHLKLLDEYLEEHDGCQWVLNDDGTAFVWDGNEKFYNYTQELQDLIDRFFKPRDYVLNGVVIWTGDDTWDVGTLYVKDNVVTVLPGLACLCDQIVSSVMSLCKGCPEPFEGCWDE